MEVITAAAQACLKPVVPNLITYCTLPFSVSAIIHCKHNVRQIRQNQRYLAVKKILNKLTIEEKITLKNKLTKVICITCIQEIQVYGNQPKDY